MKQIYRLFVPAILLVFFSAVSPGQSNTWTQKANFGGTARQNAVGFSIGAKGYIGTGRGISSSSYMKDFWEFDPVLNSWTQKANFGGTARAYAIGFSIGAKGYIGTGNDGSYKKDFWEFDPLLNAWTQKADFGGTARYYAVGFSIGAKGYVGTGSDGTRKKDFWEFDPILNTWTQKTDFGGTTRLDAVGFSVGTKGYIGTGYDGVAKKDFWEFDPSVNSWTQKADFTGTAREGTVGFSIGLKGYIGTGFDGGSKKDFWEFDPILNSWTQKALMSTNRYSGSGFAIGTRGYIGLGRDVSIMKDIWEYTPDGFRVGLLSSTSFCAGTSINIPFTISTPCNPGNIFTAQLSDSLGSFSNPVSIGSLSGTLSGTITGTIPSGSKNGNKYRIRVVSSNPAATSVDNLIDLSIFNSVPATPGAISGPIPGCLLKNNSYSISEVSNATSYIWTIPAGTSSNGSSGNSIQVLYGTSFTSGSLFVKGHNVCGDGNSSFLALSVTNCGDNWIQKSDFGGTARQYSVGFSIGARGYIGTGYDDSSQSKKDFWEFDPLLNIWTQKPDVGGNARYYAIAFSIGVKGYIGTGYYDSNRKDFWEFDPALNTWTQKADFEGTARSGAVGFSIGAKGYVGAGNDGSYKKDFWEFDPILNTWTQKADFGGTARSRPVGFSIGAKGYVGAGNDGNYKKDFWEFDPVLNTWTQKADFGGILRNSAVGFSIGTKGYFGTGIDASYNSMKDFWEFDPVLNTWTQKTDFEGSARYYAVGFSVGSKGFIGTGTTDGYNLKKDFREYTPDGFRTGTLAGTSFCAGTAVNIPYTVSTPCNPGNIFSAQLSDSLGNFSNPVLMGNLSGTTSGTIEGTIPSGSVKGHKYRIRVISSDPAAISVDNLIDLSIANSLPLTPGPISGSAFGCLQQTGPYSVPVIQDADSYLWTIPAGTTSNGSTGNSIQLLYETSFSSRSLTVKGHNGCGDGNSSNIDLSVMNCGDNWTQKVDYGGIARFFATGFSINAKGYIGTGMDNSYYLNNEFWEFDPTLNTWTQKADFGGAARYCAVGFSIGDRGYVGTGMDASYNSVKDFWEFDPKLNTWTQKADFGGTVTYSAVGFSIGAKGYVGTGSDGYIYKKDFWEFDPALNTWTQKADFGGTARDAAVGFSIGTKGYVGTGYDGNIYKKDFWEFDPALNTWTQKADFGGTDRYCAVGFSIGPKGYVGTGYDNSGNKKDFWEFDPVLNTWSQMNDFRGTARYGSVGFSIGTKGYAGTGFNGSALKDFWEYTPEGFNVGLLSGNNFCSSSAINVPFTLSAPCNPGNVFTAQLSDSLASFNNPLDIGSIVGIYSDTIPATLPSLSVDGYKYRIRVQSSDPVSTSVDNLYNISIYSATIPGIVSGGSTISLGALTDTLRLSGYAGSILTWQKQLNGGGYNDISATSGLTWYIETPTATGTWDYRTIIKNGACNTELSTSTSVVVVTGPVVKSWIGGIDENWDVAGNWSPVGVPGAQDDVIIPVSASVMPVVKAQGFSCNNILIQSGATLIVNPSIVLTVNGDITIEGQ